MKYLCIHAADASSQNLWVNTPASLLPFPQILWIGEFLKLQWVTKRSFNTPGPWGQGVTAPCTRVVRVVRRGFVTAVEGENVLNQTVWH